MATIPLLVLSGPVGVGKTTLGNEITAILEARGVPHSFVDLDGLAQSFPRPPDDPYGSRLALANLRDVWANCVATGSRNLILARVIETQQQLDLIRDCIPGSRPVLCQLRASDRTLVARVESRELGTGRDWHMARTLELARILETSAPADFSVDTEDRNPQDIAGETVSRVAWVT